MTESLKELTAQLSSLQEDMSILITRTEALDREIREEIIPRTADMWTVVMEEPGVRDSILQRRQQNRLSAQIDTRRLSAQLESNLSGSSSARLSRKWSSLRSLGSTSRRSSAGSSLSILMMNEVTVLKSSLNTS